MKMLETSRADVASWYQGEISRLQSELGDDPEDLETALTDLHTEYLHRNQSETHLTSGPQINESVQAICERRYQRLTEANDLQAIIMFIMNLIMRLKGKLGSIDTEAVKAELLQLHMKTELELQRVEASFASRKRRIRQQTPDDEGRENMLDKLEFDKQEQVDKITTDFLSEIADLQKRYGIVEESAQPEILSEGLEKWWGNLKDLINRYISQAADMAEELLDDPAALKQKTATLEAALQKKEQNGEFARETNEAWGLSNLVSIPKFFWQVYIKFMEGRYGWLRDRSWAKRVYAIDPSADPNTFTAASPYSIVRTKAHYTVVFFSAVTVALLLLIVSIGMIPVISDLISFVFFHAKEIIMEVQL
jgi:hypothetical protein